MTLFRYRALEEVIKVIRGRPQSSKTDVLLRGKDQKSFSCRVHRQIAREGYREKVAVGKPGAETLSETSPDGTLTLDFSASRIVRK